MTDGVGDTPPPRDDVVDDEGVDDAIDARTDCVAAAALIVADADVDGDAPRESVAVADDRADGEAEFDCPAVVLALLGDARAADWLADGETPRERVGVALSDDEAGAGDDVLLIDCTMEPDAVVDPEAPRESVAVAEGDVDGNASAVTDEVADGADVAGDDTVGLAEVAAPRVDDAVNDAADDGRTDADSEADSEANDADADNEEPRDRVADGVDVVNGDASADVVAVTDDD